MTQTRFFTLLFILIIPFSVAYGQDRPVPYPVTPPPAFGQAIEQGTRTASGEPGPAYWTNTASYDIRASLSPSNAMLHGHQRVTYHNNSPDTLRILVLHNHQNLHREGGVRNRQVEITGGVALHELAVGGQVLDVLERGSEFGFLEDGTVTYIRLPGGLLPGSTVDLEVAWSFRVPSAGAPRMGHDGEVFFLGYWYPQIAVYDDVEGWDDHLYMANGEFYMGYADYDIEITVPEGWLVAATGTLENPEEVLADTVIARLGQAADTREIVRIVDAEERGAGLATAAANSDSLTWRFSAENVRDFAFGASDQFIWDATSAVVGDLVGDGGSTSTMIHSLYRPGTAAWDESAYFAQYSIEYLSRRLTAYPYPHMTLVEGVIGGGMEYPMITIIGGERNDYTLFRVTLHEIVHMWYPMLVGQDEKSFTWMDEGLASFVTNDATNEFFEGTNAWDPRLQPYFNVAGTGYEVESMRHADEYPLRGPARLIASYTKPSLAFHALRGIVGAERFADALREYTVRWTNKHPQPYDLFNTFEDVLQMDLEWFWRAMFFETWTLDHAISNVDASADAVIVRIEDRGDMPMPVPIRVTFDDGSMEEQTIPVDVWLAGNREASAVFSGGTPVLVEIDPDQFLPDVDRTNNRWTR